jgi:hypothetical protein
MAARGRDPYELVDYPTELVGRLVRAIIAAGESSCSTIWRVNSDLVGESPLAR